MNRKLVLDSRKKSPGAERWRGEGGFNAVKIAFIKRRLIWWQTTLNNFKH